MILARKLTIILVGLIALGATAAYVIAQTTGPDASGLARHSCWIVLVLSAGLSTVLVLQLWRGHTRTLQQVRRQLHQLEAGRKIGMIMVDTQDELAELIRDINRYLTNLRFYIEKDRLDQHELKLQASVAETEKKQIEAVIYSISEAVLVTNADNELLLANRTAQDLFDFSLELNYRLPLDDILTDTTLLSLVSQVRINPRRQREEMLQRTDAQSGKPIYLKAVASCVLDSENNPLGVVVVLHDLTAEKELARLKDDIISGVSHELKTPLSSIQAYTEMLADNEFDNEETRREFCSVIQNQSLRLNMLIDDILNISRIEGGILRPDFQSVSLAEVAKNVTAVLHPQAQAKHIRIQTSWEDDQPLLQADQELLFRALLNLVHNAIKYSPENTTVTIRYLQPNAAQRVIEVQDQGIGIPEDQLTKIFDKFYRVPDLPETVGGTGLGLYLVWQIIHQVHQGSISVVSVPDQGSRFRLTIPTHPKLIQPNVFSSQATGGSHEA